MFWHYEQQLRLRSSTSTSRKWDVVLVVWNICRLSEVICHRVISTSFREMLRTKFRNGLWWVRMCYGRLSTKTLRKVRSMWNLRWRLCDLLENCKLSGKNSYFGMVPLVTPCFMNSRLETPTIPHRILYWMAPPSGGDPHEIFKGVTCIEGHFSNTRFMVVNLDRSSNRNVAVAVATMCTPFLVMNILVTLSASS